MKHIIHTSNFIVPELKGIVDVQKECISLHVSKLPGLQAQVCKHLNLLLSFVKFSDDFIDLLMSLFMYYNIFCGYFCYILLNVPTCFSIAPSLAEKLMC